MPEDKLGERVKMVRDGLGLTHDGLSNLAKLVDQEGRGISRTTIRGYELGTYKPGARELRILSLALKKTPSWLLFGQEEGSTSNEITTNSANQTSATPARWANLAFSLISFLQLGREEKGQIVSLVETLLRLKIGEVRFRTQKAFIEDFADTAQDMLRDHSQYKDLNPQTSKQVFYATVEEMKKRHGDEEAQLLVAILLPVIEFLESSNK